MSTTLQIPYTIVDAFTSKAFTGNPAAVVQLGDTVLSDATLQLIAREFNLGATAFLSQTDAADTFHVRWFTSTHELALCGHASLASAHVLGLPRLVLKSRVSGDLIALKTADGRVELEFPAGVPQPTSDEMKLKTGEALRKALGLDAAPSVQFVGTTPGASFPGYILIHIDDAIDLAAQKVNSAVLAAELPGTNLHILTNSAPESLGKQGKHFVSRVFATPIGIPEDSVTGSSHCMLAPYWTAHLKAGGQQLSAKQVSSRSGDVDVEWIEGSERVKIRGHAIGVCEGKLFVPSV
ncbi:Diaminopimelate epimerase-like protein [Exidia glandulosa HHB12029]|uniref:Diaminopimelate epimerase-like protein n=1 Tax=Exidia glandulosa HHB12029 TaxID=1314781 RepID=A0A165G8K6_EXIGL|nr:Diaminopimelate epimerase-like protein [Exidia glandulosa HHB12029]